MNRIFVVEDETHLAQGLRFNLEAEGYSVQLAERGEEALQRLLRDREQFDALVLDVMLPGKDGFAVARELREAQNYVPILMLTARGRPEDVLQGFECGADDYLPKPFDLPILIARIGSLLRRRNWLRSIQTPVEEPAPAGSDHLDLDIFTFAGKTADFRRLQLRTGERVLQMTLMESELLRYLIRNRGRPVSRKEILEEVWNLHVDTDTRAIDNFIVRLRRYVEPDTSKPRYLLTVRGVGYQFVAD